MNMTEHVVEENMDTFYKVTGYGCLYKSYGNTADERKAGDVTISMIREARPVKLFSDLMRDGFRIKNPHKGIYRICGVMRFQVQIIVIRELEWKNHIWLRALSGKLLSWNSVLCSLL